MYAAAGRMIRIAGRPRADSMHRRPVFYAMRALDIHDDHPKFEGIQNDNALMDGEAEYGAKGVCGKCENEKEEV
jgi:hypothetical protein